MRRRRRTCLFAIALSSAPVQVAKGQALPEWTLSPRPLLEIGGEADTPTDFVRIQGTVRLADGRIVVADGESSELRIFDRTGRHLVTFGRSGSGPGEFRRISWVGLSGDTLLISDGSLRRVTLVTLGPEPTLAELIPLTAPSDRGPYSARGRLRGGSWVVSPGAGLDFNHPREVYRVPVSYGLVPPNGQGEVRWLGQYPDVAVFVYNPTGDLRGASVGPIAFTPWSSAATTGAILWLGDSASDSLLRFAPPYTKAEPVSLGLPRRRPSREQIGAARSRELEGARSEQDRARVQAKYSSSLLPEFLPEYEALVSAGNELWIQEYAGYDQEPTRYLVLDTDGIRRGIVAVPSGFRIKEAGADYVLGVHTDEDGVERVRLYRLTRN